MVVAAAPTTLSRAPRPAGPWLLLACVVAASIALRLFANTWFQAPTILTDELTYARLARSIADGNLSLSNGYGIAYPLALAPSWLLGLPGTDAYVAMKTTNALLVSATAIPVFLWARSLVRPSLAIIAAALTVLMPSMAYSGHVMTENLFVLAFAVAAWAVAKAAERPTVKQQALAVAAVVLAFGVRPQAIVLALALPLIAILIALVEERANPCPTWKGFGRRLAYWWPTALIGGVAALSIAVRAITSGSRWDAILQAYSATTDGQYTLSKVLLYFVWHLGDAALALGVIPFAALLVLLGLLTVNRLDSPAVRGFIVVAATVTALVILQVAAFTSYWSERVSERNMFCVFPLALIALVMLIDRAMPRPRRITAFAVAISAILVMSLPLTFLYQRAPTTETWGLVVPEFLSRKVPGGADTVQFLIATGVAVALLLFVLLTPEHARWGLPLALAAYFALVQIAVVHQVGKTARDYRAVQGVGETASWIDEQQDGRPVTLLLGSALGPDTERLIVWQLEFFNRTPIRPVQVGTAVLVQPNGSLTDATGAPADLGSEIIAPWSMTPAGEQRSRNADFALWRADKPLRFAHMTSGVYPDGWTTPSAWVAVFDDTSAPTATVTASRRFGTAVFDGTVRTSVAPTTAPADQGTPGPDLVLSQTMPEGSAIIELIPVPFRIDISVDPALAPTSIGSPDARQLGARITVTSGSRQLVG